MSSAALPGTIPRLPVFSWHTFAGQHDSSLPCLLDQADIQLTTSGRASILLAMELLGLKAGDKVLVPTYHCPTMIAPVVALGAEPLFYPINERGEPELAWLKKQSLDNVKIVLAAHYFGLPLPMRALREWCDAAGLALIEDCAHSLFGVSDSRPVGHWGDISIGSLTKFLPVSEGGCLRISRAAVTAPALASPPLRQQIKAATDIIHVAASARRLFGVNHLLLGIFSLRQLFRSGGTRAGASGGEPDRSDLPIDGFTIDKSLSHRALTWAATFIAKRAPRARIVERRRRNFAELTRLLSGFKAFRPLHAKLPEGAAPYVFPLWVVEPDSGYAVLRKMGFPVSRWDRLWPGVAVLQADAGISWSHHVLQLACHQDLDDADMQTMAKVLVELYAKDETPVTNEGTLLGSAESPSRLPGPVREFTDRAAS